MSNKGRIIWIDIMRGILMISIVMGRACEKNSVN